MTGRLWPPTGEDARWGDAFAEWLEAGQRFAAESSPAAVDDAIGDMLACAFGYMGPELAIVRREELGRRDLLDLAAVTR